MKPTFYALALLIASSSMYNCASEKYPEGMTNAERKEYYQNYNESRTDQEWERIRSEKTVDSSDTIRVSKTTADRNQKDLAGSISISIKNNSLFSKRVRISDNVLTFGPLKTKYVGFKPGTKVYLIKGSPEKDEYLFTVTEDDEGKSYKIAK